MLGQGHTATGPLQIPSSITDMVHHFLIFTRPWFYININHLVVWKTDKLASTSIGPPHLTGQHQWYQRPSGGWRNSPHSTEQRTPVTKPGLLWNPGSVSLIGVLLFGGGKLHAVDQSSCAEMIPTLITLHAQFRRPMRNFSSLLSLHSSTLV